MRHTNTKIAKTFKAGIIATLAIGTMAFGPAQTASAFSGAPASLNQVITQTNVESAHSRRGFRGRGFRGRGFKGRGLKGRGFKGRSYTSRSHKDHGSHHVVKRHTYKGSEFKSHGFRHHRFDIHKHFSRDEF